MDQFQRREDVGRGEQTFRNQLGIEVVPVFASDVRRTGVLTDFRGLLDVRNRPEQHHAAVQEVPRKVDKVPHVLEVALDAFGEDLLGFLPNEADNVDHDEALEIRWTVASLAGQLFL